MTRRKYWNGFATGAAVGVGAALATWTITHYATSRGSRVIRLEKTVQIGRPVEDVFKAWSDLEQLARSTALIESVSTSGNRSHWIVNVAGKRIEWDAETEQFIPNQAIGWKSLNGPKHSGRISFSPLQNDTLVSVTMNYVPPLALLRVGSLRERIQSHLEQVLRDFKAALEGKGQETMRTGTT